MNGKLLINKKSLKGYFLVPGARLLSKSGQGTRTDILIVGEEGVEPSWSFLRNILSVVRKPFRHSPDFENEVAVGPALCRQMRGKTCTTFFP